ncbi:cupin domain-containing protein [Alkalihalobacillus macyae]|uniref:cupin domain-containing protein n=1 Tax=Guptibacillus hwajinpoensis TaxID=208199 RepID=UPI00273BC5F0|nr:cupin domain-containing protein [Alkalihalobacillus macyae]MDP4549625.1 cupin domain-containing protein [Alkalihalobacillus macyae]
MYEEPYSYQNLYQGSEVEGGNRSNYHRPPNGIGRVPVKDYGQKPFVFDINEATIQNKTYRTAIWTGDHLQVTLMSIGVGDDIGLEMHPNLDQFLRVEQGQGLVRMGEKKNDLSFEANVYDDFAILIPAGSWHNVINTGNVPLKLYSIYGPPNHPFGTVHRTKADAEAAEEGYSQNSGPQVAYRLKPDEWVQF